MRRFFIFVMILIASSACAQQGVLPYAIDSSGIPKPNSINKPMFVTPVGTTGGTATVDIVLPAIAYATPTATVLATNAVTLLSAIASYPNNTLVNWQPRGKIYYSAFSGTAPTAAWLQLNGKSMEAGDTPIQYTLKPSCNVAFTADIAAIATLSLEFCEVQ